MKKKIITLAFALFMGCAHAKDPGSADALVKQMQGKSPKQMCSDGTLSVTLRSYKGKYCNDKQVCELMKNCFPDGKDPYKAASSQCAVNCRLRFGDDDFAS